jgi:energy-coupling factor transport system ATP-binding protein
MLSANPCCWKVQTTSSSCPKLCVRSLELRYPEADKALISRLSFELAEGESLGISGANASGKSSLIHALGGIIPHYITAERKGEILFQDQALHSLPLCEIFRYMAVVLADAKAQLMFPTLESELAFALENMAVPSPLIRQRITAALDFFGLAYPLHKAPHLLSGGEQRLLLLASAQAMDSPIVLLDEPERGLSKSSLKLLLSWLKSLCQKGRIVILASHNPEVLSACDQRILLGS